MPDDSRKADIRFELERWCSDFNAFTSSICRYGYRVEETRPNDNAASYSV